MTRRRRRKQVIVRELTAADLDWPKFFKELERRKAGQLVIDWSFIAEHIQTLENEDYTYGHSEHNQPQ